MLQLDPDRMALRLADVADLVEAGVTPVCRPDFPFVPNPLAVGQRARLERVFSHADADTFQMAMRLLFRAWRNARLEYADERVVDDERVILGNDLQHVEIVGLRG